MCTPVIARLPITVGEHIDRQQDTDNWRTLK